MNTISREELKAKLDHGEPFKLVMVLNEWAFQMKHIPGSLNIPFGEKAPELLNEDEEIVVYCSGDPCAASGMVYKQLLARGFRKVRRYVGGLADWEDAGYPLEGAWA